MTRLKGLVSRLQVVVCVVWVGSCTDCLGTESHGYLSGLNIESFRGCTQVDGNLIINRTSLEGDSETDTPPITHSQLSYLINIKEITGYLLIENINFTNLRFLRNLEVLHGRQTLEYRSHQHYSLIVEDNDSLQTLSLSSLQRIENGGIRISGNPQLCLVDTLAVDEFLVSSTLRRIGGLGMDCSAYTCHEQCAPSKGCWGTLADECVECRNYYYLGTCMESCDMNISYANATSRQCLPLAPPTVVPTNPQSPTLLPSSNYNLTVAEAELNYTSSSNTTITLQNDLPTNTTTPVPLTISTSNYREDLSPDWMITVGAMCVVAVLVLLLCIVGCLRHRWKKSQSKTLKKRPKDTTRMDSKASDRNQNGVLRARASHSHSTNSSDLLKKKISISELNALSDSHSCHGFAKGQSSYYSDPGVNRAHVSESCDYHHSDHVVLQYADIPPHFHSSNSVGTHNNISIDFPNHTSYQSLPPDLSSAKRTTLIRTPTHTSNSSGTYFTNKETENSPVINGESSVDSSVRVSNNSSSTHFTSREGYRQSQMSANYRPMTGSVYSTRTSPPLRNNPLRSTGTSSHGTRTPSHHTPSHLSHRGSLTSSHGGSISRASTMTSRTSNYQSTGGSTVCSGRIAVSVHGSDSSLAGLMEQNVQPYNYEEP